jgi:hypothetical protein
MKRELIFFKPISFRNSYKLYSASNIISEMILRKSEATVSFGNDKWLFQKKGFFTIFVEITKDDLNVTLYKIPIRNFYQSKFYLKEDLMVKFELHKFYDTSWAWFDNKMNTIIEYKIGDNNLESGINIINEKYLNLERLILLIMLGWYLLITVENCAYNFALK